MPPWRPQCALLVAGVALLGEPARAQASGSGWGPEPTLAQLAHRAWTARDGAPSGVRALAQTPDGFLWIGGATGLFRFDGVRFERYEPPPAEAMPSNTVGVLATLPDGALWVGYAIGGVSAISEGGLVSYGPRDGLPAGTVNGIVRDSGGTTWVATTRGLARLVGARWHLAGAAHGFPGGFVSDLTVDRRGALWVAASAGVYVRPHGAERFVRWAPPLAVGATETGSGGVRAAPDGSVWAVSMSRGLVRLTDTAGRAVPPTSHYARDRGLKRGWYAMVIDARARAWGIGTTNRLVRVALTNAGAERRGAAPWDTLPLSPQAGSSGRMAFAVLQDREGSIWMATEGGLDQFRAPRFTTIAWPYPEDAPSIAAADAGALWAGSTSDRLTLLRDPGRARKAPPSGVTVIQRDLDGDVWVGGLSGLWHMRDGRFAAVALPRELPQSILVATARTTDGTLWVSGQRQGTFRRRGTGWERYGAPDTYANVITADSAGRTWLGYWDGRLVREGEGAARVYGAADGLHVGGILTVVVQGRRVWVGGELGVAVLDAPVPHAPTGDGERARFAPLVAADGPFRSVTGIVVTDDAVWLRDAVGVARVSATEVARVLRDPGSRVRAERFDARDRVDGPAYFMGPTAVLGTDGRLWVTWIGGLGWIDPARVRRNQIPPPVHVRGLTSDQRTYPAAGGRVTLPARTRALSVAYTALSLAVPERVRFRYRLVGLDTAWQDAGARREAFYTNLAPRAYRFEVSAANDDGVWSVAPATLDFAIPPTFVQTATFLGMCAAAAGGTLWLLAVWRQRRAVGAARARYEVAFAERMRVARELHDTLLTDVAGLRMHLDAAVRAAGSAGSAGVAASVVATLRDLASETLVNARRTVVDMRAAADAASPIADQVADAARRLFGDTSVAASVAHTGSPRRYPPAVEVEVLRIAGEALANARAHAACRSVRVTCGYRRRVLRVEVRDDGRGFDPARAAANGHYGLVGMYERAATIGAQLTVESAPGRGTVVRLVVPLRTRG